MSTLTDDELNRMRADIAEVIGDHARALALRRGTATLPVQTFRVERVGGGSREFVAGTADAAQLRVTLLGAHDADVRRGDRFTIDGRPFEVVAVSPNRQVCTQAEAIQVQ